MAKREHEKVTTRDRVLHVKRRPVGVLVGLLLTLLFIGDLLHRCGDIEENPGPGPSGKETRQTRLTSTRKVSDSASPSSSRPAATPGMTELTLTDLMETLLTIQKNVRETKDVCDSLRQEMSTLKDEVTDLRQKNTSLEKDVRDLSRKLDTVVRKSDDLENRLKRNNIIIHGIPRDEQEKTWDDCENKVKDLMKDKLHLPGEYQFDRVHRLSHKKDSPIIACFTFFKDKVKVLKAKNNLKGTNLFIGEDFSQKVREIRKKLTPHLRDAKSAGKRATMVFDHLVIEGRKFSLDGDDNLVEQR